MPNIFRELTSVLTKILFSIQGVTSCAGDRNTFDAGHGNCEAYVIGGRSHSYCATDKSADGKTAVETCRECAVCWDYVSSRSALTPVIVLNPPEHTRSYSSAWDLNHKQSMIDSNRAWCSKTRKVGDWMKIDLGRESIVSGVATQKRKEITWGSQQVTGMRVGYSVDGKTWKTIEEFTVPHLDGDDIYNSEFAAEVTARYIMITVLAYRNHPSMRAGVILSEKNTEFQLLTEQ